MRSLLQLCCSLVRPSRTFSFPYILSLQICDVPFSNAEHGVARLTPRQFIPCQVAGIPLPEIFFDWLTLSDRTAPPVDKPATDLILIITEFVQLSASARSARLFDRQPETTNMIRELLDLDGRFGAWERRQEGIWIFKDIAVTGFPPETVFHDRIHTYSSMWTARMWNHYRWSRLLLNQMLVEFVEKFPASSGPLVPDTRYGLCLDTVRRMAEDTLISVPTHWRHPKLSRTQREEIDQTIGGPGIGAAGLPALLFHVKYAVSRPDIPYEDHRWALNILDTAWSDTGMLQARALANVVRSQYDCRRANSTETGDRIIKQEPTESSSLLIME